MMNSIDQRTQQLTTIFTISVLKPMMSSFTILWFCFIGVPSPHVKLPSQIFVWVLIVQNK